MHKTGAGVINLDPPTVTHGVSFSTWLYFSSTRHPGILSAETSLKGSDFKILQEYGAECWNRNFENKRHSNT